MVNRDQFYLTHVLESLKKILDYSSVEQDEFLRSSLRIEASIRQLEVMCEAIARLSTEFLMGHPQVPWRRIKGLRDIINHDFMDVDHRLLWETTRKDLPDLHRRIKSIVNSL